MKENNNEMKGTVLVEFFATWCPHCQRMMPIVAQVEELMAGKARVVQLDIDKYENEAKEARVESVPTFIIMRDGNEVWRHTGEMEAEELLAKLRSFC